MTIGNSLKKIDAHAKVTGDALYPADTQHPNALFGKVVFSNKPHARMLSIDLSQAEAVEGVHFILTAPDVPCNEYGLTMFDQPVLVGVGSQRPHCDISLWEADQIAFVVAETRESAEIAAAKIMIEWEDLPVITDVLEAYKSDLTLHRETDHNAYQNYQIRKGDMAVGWSQADVIIEGHYKVPRQEHAYLQPEAGTAWIDEQGRITVEVAGQWTVEDQMQIAHALDLDLDKIRVIYPAIGGAFGGREDMSIQIVLALAAQKAHALGIDRPIFTQWSREESIVGHHKRHEVLINAKLGATKDGKIVAIEVDSYLDAGAYNYTSNKVLGNLHLCVGGPYEIPNARINSHAIYTNNVPGGAYRGFGAPQGCFVAENQMNKLAAALGIDPLDLRERNILREGSQSITQCPMPHGVSMPQVLAACTVHWQTEKAAPALAPFQSLPPNPAALRTGRGIACSYKNIGFSFGFPEGCDAEIELHGGKEIERVVLHHGGADVGQGSHTVFRQMTAEALNVSIDIIETLYSDTATSGNSGSVSASRMTWMAGNAIRLAAKTALENWTDEDRPAVGKVRYHAPQTTAIDPVTGAGDPNLSYGYVAEVVDVTVDVETGHIQLDRVVCVNDVGRIINRNLIEGQVEGAIVQAHGYSITENLQLRDGFIQNPRLSSYLIPGISDIPLTVESVILEVPDPRGPWGARGMGEMPFIPLAPAITAALHDATGVWFDEIPLTPSKVVAKLRAHGVGG